MSPLLGSAVDFANPAGLWALALLVPVVLLHLYRRRRRRVEVAFLPLLRETAGATSAQGAWRNVHETASLLLRCAALAAAALALAAPRPAHAGESARDLVLVIDADVTTQAFEEQRIHEGRNCVVTRFMKQVDLARALAKARPAGRTAVLLAGGSPEVLVAFGDDPARTLDDLARRAAPLGRADLRASVLLARTLAPRRGADVVVVTSRALPDGLPEGVSAVGAGATSYDQGIVDQEVVASADGLRRTVRLVLRNFDSRARSRAVRAWFEGGSTVFEKAVDLPPRVDSPLAFDVIPPRGGGSLRVSLGETDDFPANDVTGAWIARFPRPTVLVVHGGTPRPFVTAVLDAMGDSIDREGSGSVASSDLPSARLRDVMIVDGAAPPVGVPLTGGWIFLAPFGAAGASTFPFAPGRSVTQPLVWRSKADHPLLRGVDLSATFVAHATTISATAADSLAFAEGEPVLAEGTTEAGGRWIAFGLDPDGSDLPLRAALPLLLRNAIRRLGAAPAEMLQPFYRAGDVVKPRLEVPGFARGTGPTVIVSDLGEWERSHGVRPCGEEPSAQRAPERAPADRLVVPAGGRGAPVVFTGTDSVAEYTTAFVDLSRDYDITPARPAARPPPPAPPAPDVDASAASWRAILIAAAAALLLADLLLLAIRGGKVAATPVKA